MKDNEVEYNYFKDVNPEFEKRDFSLENRIDPDNTSAKLYDSLFKLFFNKESNNKVFSIDTVKIIAQKFTGKELFYTFFINNDEFLLSADYIGPSIYQVKRIGGLEDFEIKNILSLSRTLGGHIVWPRGQDMKPTINQVKGGEIYAKCGYGFYDRIDWILKLLKIYYSFLENEIEPDLGEFFNNIKKEFANNLISKNDMKCFREMYQALNRADTWFAKFKTFSQFCDFFQLTGSFVNNEYEVNELTSYFPIKPSKDNYHIYIRNNLKAIYHRNLIIK